MKERGLLLLAIAAFLFYALGWWAWFGGPSGDVVKQLASAQAILDGRGFTKLDVTADGLLRRSPLTGWPISYALLAAPLIAVLDDPARADLCLRGLALIAYLGAIISILRQIAPGPSRRAWYFGLALCMWRPWDQLGTPELFSIASSLASISLTIAAASRATVRLGTCDLALAMGAAVLAAAFRFAAWPLVVVPPLCAVAVWWRASPRPGGLLPQLATAIAIGGAGMLGVSTLQRAFIGSTTFLSQRYAGVPLEFHWDHLGRFAPFFADLGGAANFIDALQFGRPDLANLALGVKWLICALICIVVVVARPRPPQSAARPQAAFAIISMLASAVIVVMLTILSLCLPPQLDPQRIFTLDGLWTYVEERRYYHLIVALAAVSIFAAPKPRPALRAIGLLLLAGPSLLSVYKLSSLVLNLNDSRSNVVARKVIEARVRDSVRSTIRAGNERVVVVTRYGPARSAAEQAGAAASAPEETNLRNVALDSVILRFDDAGAPFSAEAASSTGSTR